MATVAMSRQLFLRPPRRVLPSTTRRRLQSRNASLATASNLSPSDQKTISHETTLPTPDPAADSQTARLVSSQAHFMVPTYVRPTPIFTRGEGCHLYDLENRKYLDFTAGIAVNALGHCDAGMARILAQQAQTLVHTSNLYHNPWTGSLSQLLVEHTLSSGGMRGAKRAFICNSGSEANEAAIKFCRKHGGSVAKSVSTGTDATGTSSTTTTTATTARKDEIVSFHGSFHGRTMGSLSATPNAKYQKPFGPMVPGFRYGVFNDVEAVHDLITPETCGVLVEPIQGEGGINVATPEFLQALRRRCDEVDALLVFDEIQCGLGRTGTLWAHTSPSQSHPDRSQSRLLHPAAHPTATTQVPAAHPDILTTAKALGNGFPIGATIVTDRVSDALVTGDHGTTFGGNPLGARVAHYVLTRLTDRTLQASVLAKEGVFRLHFERLRKRFPEVVGEVRGRGLMLGLQMMAGETGSTVVTRVITAARERGLLVISCGTDTLRFVPPLVITEAQIEEGMVILEEAIRVVSSETRAGVEEIEGTDGQQEMRVAA